MSRASWSKKKRDLFRTVRFSHRPVILASNQPGVTVKTKYYCSRVRCHWPSYILHRSYSASFFFSPVFFLFHCVWRMPVFSDKRQLCDLLSERSLSVRFPLSWPFSAWQCSIFTLSHQHIPINEKKKKRRRQVWPGGGNVCIWELEGCLDREGRNSEGDFREQLRQAMKEK